jgi:hypothetical protein
VQVLGLQTNRLRAVCVQTLVPWGWRGSSPPCPRIDKTKGLAADHSTWRLLTLCSKAFVLSVPIICHKGNSFCVPHGESPLLLKVNVGQHLTGHLSPARNRTKLSVPESIKGK